MISATTNPILPDSGDLAQLVIVVSVVLGAVLAAVAAITIRRRRATQR